jgi:hypothetical protein
LIFYCAMVGGWAAFAGWFVCEGLLMQRGSSVDTWKIVATAAFIGALVGGGLNFLAGAANGNVVQALPRLAYGLGAGFLGGGIGCVVGNLFYLAAVSLKLPLVLCEAVRVAGWVVMGLGIGVVEGATDLSPRKIVNGLLGGAVGGFLGGFFFALTLFVVRIPMSSRAIGLVLLGMCIGLAVGLAQVILREAWLTVEEGFRPGRQLLLSKAQTFLGTSEKAQLSFIAFGAKGVEPLHLCILRQPDGSYWVRDNGSRTGTFVNEQPVTAEPVRLKSGDVMRFGVNKVRFNERFRAAGTASAPPPAMAPRPAVSAQHAIQAALGAALVAPPPRAEPAAPAPGGAPVVPAWRGAAALPVAQAIQAAPVVQVPTAAPVVVPVAAPAPASPPPPARNPDECPVCGLRSAAPAGKRRCDNCGIPF